MLKTLTGTSDDETSTSSASVLSGITNLDSYVSSSLSSVNAGTAYSTELLSKDYKLSNLSNALNAISSTDSFETISNLNQYAANLIKYSQDSEYENLSSASSATSAFANTNLMQYVTNAYKSSSALTSLQGSAVDVET